MFSAISLRTKLISVVTVILLAGFFLTNLLNYEVSKSALRATVLQNELPLSSNNIYSEIQADLLRPIFISSLMANDVFVQDWVLDGEKDTDRMVRYIANIHKKYKTYTAYFISNQTLKYYHFSGVSRVLSKDAAEDQWFFDAEKSKDPYLINIDTNKAQNGTITIFINYKVVDKKGDFLGVIGVGLHMKGVQHLVEKYQNNFRRNIYFVDQSGLIRINVNHALENNANIHEFPGLKDIADDVLNKGEGANSYDTNADTILLTWRYIPELKWYLFIELPESQAIKTLKKGFMRNLVIGPLVILPTILLIGFTINVFQRRLEVAAITDKLTGVKNRDFFDASLKQAIKQYQRDKIPFSLLLLDIDYFKNINDKMGHSAGDIVIKRTAEIITETVREVDIVCRWGGEEFTVLAFNCNVLDARRLSDAIHQALRDEVFFKDRSDYRLTVSFGITEVIPEDDEIIIFSRVDKALYMAKSNGRDRTESL